MVTSAPPMSFPRYFPPFAITLTSTCVGVPINIPLLLASSLPPTLTRVRVPHRSGRTRLRVQLFREEFEYALVLVGPTVGAVEGVVFDGVGRDLPVLFAEFDETLDEAD